MRRAPRFSIVIPTRDRAGILAGALRSAVAQTETDLEIVVSDNASADGTAAVAAGVGDPRIRIVRTPRPLPMHESWRFAVAQARGAVLTILCDDDALHPEALARADAVRLDTGAEVVSWRACSFLDAAYAGDGAGPRLRFGPPYADRALPLDGAALLDAVGRLEVTTTELAPRGLNCLWTRPLLDRITAAGTSPFLPSCPDYSFMLVAAAYARSIVLVDAPLLVAGATVASIGASSLADGAVAEVFLDELRAGTPDLVAPPDLDPLIRWAAQTYLQCARAVPALRGRTLAAAPAAPREDHLRTDRPGPAGLGLGPFRVAPRDPGDATIDEVAAGLPAELAARAERLDGLWPALDDRSGARDVVFYGLGLNGRALLRTRAGQALRARLLGADDGRTDVPRGVDGLVPVTTLDPARHLVVVTPEDPAAIVARLSARGFARGRDLLTIDDLAAAPAVA